MRSRFRWKIWLPVLMAIGLTFVFLSPHQSGSEPQEVWCDVKQGSLPIIVTQTGEVRAEYSMDIKAPMEWRMDLQIIDMVPEGVVVQEGDFLIRFDSSQLQQQLDMAKDRLAISRAEKRKLETEIESRMRELNNSLEAAKYSRDIAELQLELLKYESENRRQDALLEKQKAEVQYAEAETNIESETIINQAHLHQTEVKIQEALGEVRELENKIQEMTLTAPRTGMVVYSEIGRNDRHKVAIGDKPFPGEIVLSIPDLSQMEVLAEVNEMDAMRLEPGQPATLSLDAYPEKIFTGQVKEISQVALKAGKEENVREFQVVVTVDQTDPILKPGMTTQLHVTTQTLENIVHVPLAAVFESDGQACVISKSSYPEPIPVTVTARSDLYAAIETSELDVDDKVSTLAMENLRRYGFRNYLTRTGEREGLIANALHEMDQRGLDYDYDGRRDRQMITDLDSTAVPVDPEKIRAQIQVMQKSGKAMELDPSAMKKLKKALAGQDSGKIEVKSPQEEQAK